MQTPQPHDDSAPPPSQLAAATPPARAGADTDQHQEDTQTRDAASHCSEDDGGVSPSDGQVCSENKGAGSERGSSSSEQRDDSGDEDFSLESSAGDSDEEAFTEASAPSTDESEEDLSNFLLDVDLNTQVTELIQSDPCESGCARGKAKELESLVCSLSQMTKAEKTTSLYTLLAVLMQIPVDRKRGSGDRERFNYYLPFVGQVCRPVFRYGLRRCTHDYSALQETHS
ncbi:hypothetical protein PF007_g14944 [Phytophthora fragariae]|uniref:Uncharacterized protein n=1 Tax=Phytophthora fragariae TaxID=53985 RepID=A0A6A3TR30_9STRA|nr:hypothetical protein PF003_g15744 [Phytophthora fragariae]KAE8934080.1 hypothetical protein PF009_g15942 [Phytophthora fragariae]KAE9101945.1 hypothetical protein PF007_g14944 [Phytophthora fragariae]KAE9139119.1 hypothetical protein PF006_g13821 [Phytophthora fragariae]KAE9326426.1 hypothetical protein PF001_g2437 [Phytophthora fragariae]